MVNYGLFKSRISGDSSQFHEIFARPIEINHNENQIQILQQLISPLILRRLKTDPNLIPDLPLKPR